MYTVFSYLLWHSHLSCPMYQTHWGCMSIETAAASAEWRQLCPTGRPHRWQPTRLSRPWDSPGKDTGVGCHFLLQCMKVKSESEVAQSCLTLCDPMDCSPPGSSVHRIFQARVLEWVAIAFSELGVRLCQSWDSPSFSIKKKKDTVGHPEVVADLFSQNLTQERHCHL